MEQNDVSGLNFKKDRRKNNCDKERNVTTIDPTYNMEELDTVSRRKRISKKVCDKPQAVIEIKTHATINVVNEKNENNSVDKIKDQNGNVENIAYYSGSDDSQENDKKIIDTELEANVEVFENRDVNDSLGSGENDLEMEVFEDFFNAFKVSQMETDSVFDKGTLNVENPPGNKIQNDIENHNDSKIVSFKVQDDFDPQNISLENGDDQNIDSIIHHATEMKNIKTIDIMNEPIDKFEDQDENFAHMASPDQADMEIRKLSDDIIEERCKKQQDNFLDYSIDDVTISRFKNDLKMNKETFCNSVNENKVDNDSNSLDGDDLEGDA